jgi:hypothetical protein
MNVSENSTQLQNTNVLSLFGNTNREETDTLQELLNEAEVEAWEEEEETVIVAKAPRKIVTESQFPDQSLYILEQQLASLNESMGRLRFYLSDLNDLLPN